MAMYLVASIGLGLHRCHCCGNVETVFFLNAAVNIEHAHDHCSHGCKTAHNADNGVHAHDIDGGENCTEIFVVRDDIRLSDDHADDDILLAAALPIIYREDVEPVSQKFLAEFGYENAAVCLNVQDFLSDVSQWRL